MMVEFMDSSMMKTKIQILVLQKFSILQFLNDPPRVLFMNQKIFYFLQILMKWILWLPNLSLQVIKIFYLQIFPFSIRDYKLLPVIFPFLVSKDSDDTSDDEVPKASKKDNAKLKKKVADRAKAYGIEAQRIQLEEAVERQKLKRIPVIDPIDQRTLKKAKEASNDRLNKMLRPSKSIQRAARSASELSEAALANFQMSNANRAARQGKKDAIEGMSSSFVNASF